MISEELLSEVNELNIRITSIKEKASKFFSDVSVPLDERWDVFTQVPTYYKNHQGWVVQFECEKRFGEISWYDEFYVEKTSTVNMVEMIDSMYDKMDEDEDVKYTQEFIDALREEILQRNLGTFNFDW